MSNFINKIKYFKKIIKEANVIYNMAHDASYENNRLLGEIIRNTHSIEKGLSLQNVRLGFGLAKIEEACGFVRKYYENGGDMNAAPLLMFLDALKSYIAYHEKMDFKNETVEKVLRLVEGLNKIVPSSTLEHGGILEFEKPNYTSDEYNAFEKIIKDRHSAREFDHTPVNPGKLKKAIELAMRCPSACNRQCYRLYILEQSDFGLLNDWIGGTGGFDKELDKLLIITGKTSMYRLNEQYQHIVTSSIFAGYLTLTLQANGIGACVIQRSLFPNDSWERVKKNLCITGDEMPVCCIGIGNLKDSSKAPVSYRLSYEEIVTNVSIHDK